MRVKNKTSKTLIVRFQISGCDEDIEKVKPGETGNLWQYLEEGYALVIEEADEKERRDYAKDCLD